MRTEIEYTVCVKHNPGTVSKCTVDLWNIEENQGEQVSKCVTAIPSRPQSTEVTSASCTPPGKDVAIPFLRLMVGEKLMFCKESIPCKTPLCSQSVSSAKCFKPCGSILDKRQKLVQQGEEESEARSQPCMAVPILPQRPSPGLPSHQACCWVWGHRTLSSCPQLGSKTVRRAGRGARGHPQARAVICSPRTSWVTILGLTSTEFCEEICPTDRISHCFLY